MSGALGQTEASRSRLQTRTRPREVVAQAVVGIPFLIAAGLLLGLGLDRPVDAADVAIFVVAAAILGRLEFEAGSGYTVPTQLVFVPMLFVLPPAIVPLVVAAALLLDRIPDVVTSRWDVGRLMWVPGDAWFAIGPSLVFILAGVDGPALGDWPVYLLALAAQFAGDLCASMVRERIAHGIPPRLQLRILREVWIVDALLSPIGLLAALASTMQRYAFLLALPLAVLLGRFARERRERIGQAIELSAAYRGTALLLGDVIESDDEYTGRHSKGVVDLAIAIAVELELDDETRRRVEFGALLHDIGKIATPKELVNKPGPLTPAEQLVMREHTVVGQEMLDRVGGALQDVGLIVRSSHEHYDGGGYPDGLAGEAIELEARIVAVADTYSAMTTRRPYRDAIPHGAAVSELRANAGTQFDPVVVAAALSVMARETRSETQALAGSPGQGAS
jgi:putative nucleotidyltransferase with HDIG domain